MKEDVVANEDGTPVEAMVQSSSQSSTSRISAGDHLAPLQAHCPCCGCWLAADEPHEPVCAGPNGPQGSDPIADTRPRPGSRLGLWRHVRELKDQAPPFQLAPGASRAGLMLRRPVARLLSVRPLVWTTRLRLPAVYRDGPGLPELGRTPAYSAESRARTGRTLRTELYSAGRNRAIFKTGEVA